MPNGIFNLKQQVAGIQQGAWTGQKTPAVNYLVVAGGGGGGGSYSNGSGSGGGAGGLLQGNIPVAIGSSITVTVGSGGTAGSASSSSAQTNGSNSVFGSIAATGGGCGSANNAGAAGGSGGGGSSASSSTLSGGSGTSGQGNTGGNAFGTALNIPNGGGGGAGTVGLNATSTTVAGNGGAGIASDISGTRTTYAGGGGGGVYSSGTVGTGGAGGGGSGSVGVAATSGTANTGGGGGGAGYSGAHYAGGAGGSGIVIISYPDTYAAATSTTGSPTVSTSGSGSISFNGSTYLNYGDQTAFEFGSGDFTIEAWVYITSLASNNYIAAKYTGGSIPASEFLFYVSSAGALSLALDSSTPSNDETVVATATSAITTNQWTHVAATRSGSTVRLFVGGSVSQTATYTRTINSTSVALTVGGITSGSLVGYMSNFRIVKGTAVYTGAFTPSTIPLTAISGTSLLLNSVSGSFLADSSGNAFSVSVPSGTATWNSSSPFATGLGYKNRVYTWTSSGSITF